MTGEKPKTVFDMLAEAARGDFKFSSLYSGPTAELVKQGEEILDEKNRKRKAFLQSLN